jgi:hypothetical protein
MADLVHERALTLTDAQGTVYVAARIYAAPNGRTTWAGWVQFVHADGKPGPKTGLETTQSNLEGVAYWATGLEPVYFEGALQRATAATEGLDEDDAPPRPVSAANRDDAGTAHLRLESIDPAAPLRLMATRTLVPGQRRMIKQGGLLVYERTVRAPSAGQPGVFEFVAQFGSRNGAGLMANTLWNDLHGLGARLLVDGEEVELTNAAIKDALMAAQLP